MMNTTPEWHRQPGESEKAFDGFQRYLNLGPERSVESLQQEYEKGGIQRSASLLRRWSCEWRWVARCQAHADHMSRVEQEAKERVRAERAELWEHRRLQSAARNWKLAKKLRQKALQMLDVPLSEVPARWGLQTAASIAKVAAELSAVAVSEATGGDDDAFDPSTATAEECAEYLVRQGVPFRRKQAGPIE